MSTELEQAAKRRSSSREDNTGADVGRHSLLLSIYYTTVWYAFKLYDCKS